VCRAPRKRRKTERSGWLSRPPAPPALRAVAARRASPFQVFLLFSKIVNRFYQKLLRNLIKTKEMFAKKMEKVRTFLLLLKNKNWQKG
jgi:hypothetical protein